MGVRLVSEGRVVENVEEEKHPLGHRKGMRSHAGALTISSAVVAMEAR